MANDNNGGHMTPDEIVSTLMHCELPAVLVEGKDDMRVFSRIEDCLQSKARVINCGGRPTLLKVFSRRSEFSNLPTVFIVDCDMYFFTGIPKNYADGIIFTSGYSIENDLIADSPLFDNYSDDEILSLYEKIKDELSVWWAFEVEEHLAKRPTHFNASFQSLIGWSDGPTKLRESAFCKEGRSFRRPCNERVMSVKENFELAMRGHQLLEIHSLLYTRAQKNDVRVTKKGLVTLLLSWPLSHHMERLVNEVQEGLLLNEIQPLLDES